MYPCNSYSAVKIKNETYRIGDDILLQTVGESLLIAKLIRIITRNGVKKYPYWPTIEVAWCLFNQVLQKVRLKPR